MIIDEWFAAAVGTRMNPDGHYGLQCVDAVDYYAEFIFGIPWPQSVGGVNGANNLLDVAPDEYWTRIDYYHGFIPQYGDVLVFEGDHYNQWGHTAVTLSATNTRITVVQQDGFAAPLRWVDEAFYSDKPAHVAYLNYSADGTGPLAGVLRPKPEKLVEKEDDMAISYDDRVFLQTVDNQNADRVINHLVPIINSQFEATIKLIRSAVDIDEEALAEALLAKGDLVVSKKPE